MHAATGRARPILLTLIFTGLRSSELRGLRWIDVDLKRGELHVRQRADRYNAIGKPKSESGDRTIPLGPLALNVLKEWKLACPKGGLGLVFPNGKGNIEEHGNIIKRILAPVQVAAGVVNAKGGAKYGAPMRSGTSTPPGASTGGRMAGSSCRSRRCSSGSVTPRSS